MKDTPLNNLIVTILIALAGFLMLLWAGGVR